MNLHIFSKLLTCSSLALCAVGLLIFPQEISRGVQDSLDLCLNTLLPSLYPFFILSSLSVKFGIGQSLGRILSPVMVPLFHLPGRCSVPVVLGLLGGYPTGAKTAITMYQERQCTRDEAQRLLSFCVNCGPAFLIGTVGNVLFGRTEYGLLLALVHILSAVSTGILTNHRYPKYDQKKKGYTATRSVSFFTAFVTSITDSLRTFIDLSAFVLCFSVLTRLLTLSGLTDFISRILLPFLDQANSSAFITGILEMTQGVMALQSGPVAQRLILASGILGWGGLSVHLQVMALFQDTDLSPASYFRGKLLHALFSMLWMTCILYRPGIVYWPAAGYLIYSLWRQGKKAVEKATHILYNGRRNTREL